MSDWDDEDEEEDEGSAYDRFGWDYYSESRPRKVKDGLKVKSERGAIGSTWWSKRWVKALEGLGMGSRLTRGRSYARQGQVVSIDIQTGRVEARVQGSLRTPYKVEIKLQPFDKRQWDAVADVMAAQAIFAAKLLAGEMPENIEEAFEVAHVSLFPTAQADLQTKCTCPDWANPCKHVAAVYYILADRFDEDPFLLFKLRGRSKEQILAELRARRNATVDSETHRDDAGDREAHSDEVMHLEDYLATFWQGDEELPVSTWRAKSAHDGSVDKAVLKRLGDAPFVLGGKATTDWLSQVYDKIAQAMKQEEES